MKVLALSKNLAVFYFGSICVQEESFKGTDTTKWIGEHIPISFSIPSNHVEQPILLFNADPHNVAASFIAALEHLASHSELNVKTLLFDIEEATKIRLYRMLETLSQRQKRRGQVIETEDLRFQEDSDDNCASTQFFQKQKNQLIDLQEQLELYCNMFPVFGLSNAKNDINLIKSFLQPMLISLRYIEQWLLKKLTITFLSSLVTLNSWKS